MLAALVLARQIASIDRRIEESFARDRWSWVPVYGLVLLIRDECERAELLALRTRLETQRILELERR